jgi:2-haloacid dehalogenase
MAAALIFDVMGTLFELAPLRERLQAVGAPGASLEAWFGRLLHTAASLTLAGEFRPFAEIAEASLRTTLAQQGLDEDRATDVIARLGELPPYDDAEESLSRAHEAGAAVAVLTNGGEAHTRKLLGSARLDHYIDAFISVEEVRAYKPAPAPYHHAAERLGVDAGNTTLIAAHGWDVVGALSAGLQAIWVDRLERRWPFPFAEPRRASSVAEAVAEVVGGR